MIALTQDAALRRVGWHPGIPVRRSVETREGVVFHFAEADIPRWRTWRARLVVRYCWRIRYRWLWLKAAFE
jgi:hypothetical protein